MHKPFSEEIEFGSKYVLRMVPEDDISQKIIDFCKEKNISRAVIVSAIGSAKDVVFRDLKEGVGIPLELAKTNEMNLRGPFEVLSLEGNVFPMDNDLVAHLHVLLGMQNGSVCGGHLFKAKVLSTLEVILMEIKGSSVCRQKSDETGLNELWDGSC